MRPYMFLIMTINKSTASKNLLKFFLTHKNQDLKKAVLYGGGLFTAQRRHSLHSGGFVCIVEARSAQQIWEARVCIAKAHGVQGFPPSLDKVFFKINKMAGTLRVHFQAHQPTCPRYSRREHRVLQYLDFTVSHFSMVIIKIISFFTLVFVFVKEKYFFQERHIEFGKKKT